MRRRPEQLRARKTLDDILSAAKVLIGERGTEGFSMTELAQHAGLSKPALYRYFPNKKAILVELTQSVFEENRHLVARHLAATRSGKEKEVLVKTLTAYCSVHTGEPYRRHLRAAMSADPDLVELDLADSEHNARQATQALHPFFPTIEKDELHRRLLILMNQMEPFAKLVASRPKAEWHHFIQSYASLCLATLQPSS
ncbi:MAG TPA: hypothetical protein DCF62_10770 [Porticoccaceae bacterium]|uniref:TetR/AcrR family transcriptional regulator n=1 Tax=Alcanivorax profundi TaxID=2338368 RepID=A0A418XYX5_9GAMM|nr:TetR/AcrR family transcriptional regulator [Alcanivorax profundi]RJG18197.1 TetR/AcrR family transcriptional regulator [Alcanivorax profundi]HAD09958.1 hypothetical protein [Porticoccaceae bacterium]